ncbi:activating transcription factor 7-interacting protein 2 [Anarrhichthys ocellatus]|uniref:activating transcription factor 7-interacting protein 2 n=1 Tax=Anarrhichthys ocellatus TaxID=433405 RepID=UPI0012EE17C9|nr:activating transcription factor 7-interacting protein 2 [Anarrhichthys ocellatus]
MADHTGSKRPAPKRRRPPNKGKSHKQHSHVQKETRVTIGLAFERWRELKTTNGLKTDAEVALSLLDVMQRSPASSPASSGAPAKKLKFSQLEVETLIEQEVHAAVQKKESKLQGLIETIQQLDRAVDYSSSIQTLEARINTVTKRAEAAIAFMTEEQKKSPMPSLVNVKTREHSEDETLEAESQTDMKSMDESGEVFEAMENTKEALKKMQADNEALTGAITDLSEDLSPPVLTPYGSPKGKVKKEPKYKQEIQNNVVELTQREEPKAGPVKVETKHTNSERDKVLYPPLPSNPFPSTLNMEAAKYNIPQILQVKMALIRRPPGLSVLWSVEEKDPSRPPMDIYRVFISVEKEKGSNVFPAWTIQVVDAKDKEPPICHVINKYQAGRKICVAVVGKDAFGRYGPYSEVVTVSLPD